MRLERTLIQYLLGDVKRKKVKKKKMEWTFMQPALVLARHRVAIAWMNTWGPSLQGWRNDIKEWEVAEDMRLRQEMNPLKANNADDILLLRQERGSARGRGCIYGRFIDC
ncbi:hypothetical protein NDU88_002298 [Pleurodeles waltl]|uniref:Uncharacterized protein n=1 Tax=Pleurodeles waltl TaxID=8319 RepID=A0AAV7Q6H2_PLEWA|nr:hypothetical protein NDU88_002298 [Pleurodeles waltl]